MASSYRGWPVQTCCRTPIPWCTWWCRRGRCSAWSHGAETTWGKPRTAGRTHTASSGSAEAEEKKHTREENMSTHDSMWAIYVILQVCKLSIPLLLMTYVSSKRPVMNTQHPHTDHSYNIGELSMFSEVKAVDITYIQACVEQNVSERLCLAQNGINQDDNWVIFYVFVHWLLAWLLQNTNTQTKSAKAIITMLQPKDDTNVNDYCESA